MKFEEITDEATTAWAKNKLHELVDKRLIRPTVVTERQWVAALMPTGLHFSEDQAQCVVKAMHNRQSVDFLAVAAEPLDIPFCI